MVLGIKTKKEKEQLAHIESSSHIHYKQEIITIKEEMRKLSANYEMLTAKGEAQKELREITNSKIDKLGEQIGEIKELFKVISSEKKELEVKVGQSLQIVSQIEPSKLIKQFTTINHQMSVIDGKVQLVQKQYDSFKKDFEHFGHKLKVLKGDDELLKLQNKIKTDLDDVHKVANLANMHAAKIENHYIKINERAASLAKNQDELKALREELINLKVELTKQLDKIVNKAPEEKHVDTAANEERLGAIESTLNTLTDVMTQSLDELRHEITSAKLKIHETAHLKLNAIDKDDYNKTKAWVAHLIKRHEK